MSELTPEEKRRIYEEEKERMAARGKVEQEKVAKATKGVSTGCAIVIAVVALIVGYILLAPPDKGSSAKEKPTFSATAKADIISKTQEAQANGLIKKLDVRAGKAWIEDLTWASVNSETKENVTRTLAAYCAIQQDTEYWSIEIVGWQSGKKLGSYSSLRGFRVY